MSEHICANCGAHFPLPAGPGVYCPECGEPVHKPKPLPAFCREPAHDYGYDIVQGREITNKRIATIYVEDGLVLRIDGDREDHLPRSGAEAARLLAGAGYALDPTSVALIDELRRDGG